jgi:ubiquinone/menaquinone biosynthesis C-methylase UbiE
MTIHEHQEHYWDKVAYDKTFTTPFDFETFSRYVNQDAKILDYGCGYGRTLIDLGNRGFSELYGVDFSEQMINRAREIGRGVNYSVIKSACLPFEDGTFDAVLLFAVLTCVYRDEEQGAIISEVNRVLKPGGIIYINDFLINQDERNKTRYNKFQDKYQYGVFELDDGAIVRHHGEEDVQRLVTRFNTLYYKTVEYVTMNGNKSNGFVYIGRTLK